MVSTADLAIAGTGINNESVVRSAGGLLLDAALVDAALEIHCNLGLGPSLTELLSPTQMHELMGRLNLAQRSLCLLPDTGNSCHFSDGECAR